MRYWIGLVAACVASTAQAADTAIGDLVLHAGQFSALRDNKSKSFTAGLEYRFAEVGYGIRPSVGFLGNDDAAMYAYGGFNWDIPLKSIEPFQITPGIAAGAYSQGDSKDLGHWLEFRSSLEVTYKFEGGQRVGAAISHLSNAGIGSSNPGTETIQLVYSFPM